MKDGANSATIAVEFNENFNTVKIQGDATWVGDAETGQVNVGEISGVFSLEGNSVTYYELLEDAPEDYCKFTLTFGTKSLTVTGDNGQCGGMNVSFNGKYKLKGAAPKKWTAFEEKFSEQLAPIGGELGQFWSQFQKAVASKTTAQLADLISYPFVTGNDGGDAPNKAALAKTVGEIFPAFVIKKITKTNSPSLISAFNPKGALSIVTLDEIEWMQDPEPYKKIIDPTAPIYHFFGGDEKVSNGSYSYSYYFAKINGKYKLFFAERQEFS